MKNDEMWIAVTRTKNDLAGVFEFDGEVGYFYLYRILASQGKRIVGSIHIVSGAPGFNRVLQNSFCVNYSCYKSLIIKGHFSAFFGKHAYFSTLLSKPMLKFGGRQTRRLSDCSYIQCCGPHSMPNTIPRLGVTTTRTANPKFRRMLRVVFRQAATNNMACAAYLNCAGVSPHY
jgi:hypothetical protein